MFKIIQKNKILVITLILFFLIRIFVNFYLNIQLNGTSYGYHLLNKELLHKDLLKSLFFLHSQPYLWNLLNGLVVKLFDGNEILIIEFFTIYHLILTIFSIYIFLRILKYFELKNWQTLFILVFISINPTIIFYENIFSYAHTTFFLFNVLIYFIFKFFFHKNKNRYEIYIYITFYLLGSIWLLFQPLILIPISFLILKKYNPINKKTTIAAIILIFLTSIPIIKNKLVFGDYIFSSKSGQDFGTVFYDWQKYCGHPIINKDDYIKLYFEKHKSFYILDHASLIGEKAGFNHIGMIELGKNCFKKTVYRIIENPTEYFKSRILSFLASHGKFGFEYVYPNPKGWKKYYVSYYDNIIKKKKS